MSVIINNHAYNFVKCAYEANNLCILVYREEKDNEWELYSDLTINLGVALAGNSAYLNDECGKEVKAWLEKNEYITYLPTMFPYALVEFSKGFMDLILVKEEDLW